MSLDRANTRFEFKNLEDEEETTKIEEIRGLRFSYFRSLVLAPLLTVCTGLIFGLLLYWLPELQGWMFYTETSDLREVTHLRVKGISKNHYFYFLHKISTS
jgi:P5-type ATPase cation transporter